jgi:hypothetical protein
MEESCVVTRKTKVAGFGWKAHLDYKEIVRYEEVYVGFKDYI